MATPSTTRSDAGPRRSRSTSKACWPTENPFPSRAPSTTSKADESLADWRDGATIAFVPLILDKGSPRRINVSLDVGLLRAIDEEAKRRGMTRSAFLSSAARNEIEGR